MTTLLSAVRAGDSRALGGLMQLVYDDLRELAAGQLRREAGPRTVRATALVHEAYMKLAAGGPVPAQDRVHFLAIAARCMRQVLVDQARKRRAVRRGGDWVRTTLSDGGGTVELDPVELLALDGALSELAPRQRQIVEMRFFGGLDETEVAEVLGVSDRTVRREWVKARARLYRELYVRADRPSDRSRPPSGTTSESTP